MTLKMTNAEFQMKKLPSMAPPSIRHPSFVILK
jgi:hypothetical protein